MSQSENRHRPQFAAGSGRINNKHYDAIFVGNGLVSLSAAALLSKRGRSVCFLDTTEMRERTVPDEAFYYALGPYLYFGFEKGGAMEGFFSELSLPIPNLKKDGLVYQKCNPSLQVIQSTHRLNVYAGKEDYGDELKREFGGQIKEIKAYLKEVERIYLLLYPFLGRFSQLELQGVGDRLNEWGQRRDFANMLGRYQRKTALDFLEPYLFNKPFLDYLDLHALFAYRKHLSDISAYDLIILVSGLQRGGVRVLGGCRTVIDFLRNLILRWGGEILKNKKVLDVEMKGRRIVEGLRLDDGSFLKGRQFTVSQSKPNATLHFYYYIREEIIPSPMKETLVMTWEKPPPENFIDALIVRLSLPQEEEGFRKGVRGLSVTAMMQPGTQIDPARLKDLRKRVLDRLHGLIPFSKGIIEEAGETIPQPAGEDAVRLLPKALEHRLGDKAKPISNGLLNYLQPREGRNLFLLPSDFFEPIGGGASFLAAKTLADVIEKSK